MNLLDRLFLHSRYFENEQDLRKVRILRNAIILTSLFSFTYLFTCVIIEFHIGFNAMLFNAITYLFVPFLLKTRTPYTAVVNIFIVIAFIAINLIVFHSGGLMSPVMPWIAAAPAIAMMVGNKKTAFFWLYASLRAAGFFSYQFYSKSIPEIAYNQSFENTAYFFSICMLGLIAIVFVINNVFETAKSKALTEVERKNKEILEINEELIAQKEEIETQRDTIEEKNTILEKTHDEILNKNQLIQKKNEDIMSSINYARRIQEAMLPHKEDIIKGIPESFIFFKPRDVVSGDFYWFADKKGRKIISALDCTGHGVPGALMSMTGNNLLNEIILNKGIVLPNRIFEELDKGIIDSLKQEQTSNRDGMDGALCSIYEEEDGKKIVEFVGARNPLIIVRNGEHEKIKGDKLSIGGEKTSDKLKTNKTFTTHRIEVSEPSMFYIFSDGFQDQFGGPKDSKYMTKKLHKLMANIGHLPIAEQGKIFESELNEWKGTGDQIDDILIIGFKVG